MHDQEWNPGRLIKLSGGYWGACALHAGVKLRIFTLLDRQMRSAADLARTCGADLRGLTMLLNALSAVGLLVKDGDQYRNTPFAQDFLREDAPGYLGHILLHHHHLMESWAHLDQAVMSGKPQRVRTSYSDDARREAFLMGMFNLASLLAPQLVPHVDLEGRRQLLDLGGGPGTYAIHFCQHNPELRATVYDLPTSRRFAEKTINRFGLAERIDFQAGDFLNDPIEGTFDIAWLSHILHAEDPSSCRAIVRKAVDALQPGGLLIIHEFVLDNSMDSPLLPALFSLNMLLGTSGGQAYSQQQIMDMLSRAGLVNVRRIPFASPGETGLVCGEVPK